MDWDEEFGSPVSGDRAVFGRVYNDSDALDVAENAVNRMAGWLSQMVLTDERFLRATPADRVVEFAGRILRSDTGCHFKHSEAVKEIMTFISQSWQAPAWSKTLTLLYHYNWKPAVIVSNTLAVLMMVFFSYNLLPGMMKAPRFHADEIYLGPWSLCVGVVSFVLVLVFRPPRELVFLDRVCINQADPADKREGVLNIGACLKHSKKLLVIWENTFSQRFLRLATIHFCPCFILGSSSSRRRTRRRRKGKKRTRRGRKPLTLLFSLITNKLRLWCMFEVAAFLKSHENTDLVVQPLCIAEYVVGVFCLNCVFWGGAVFLPCGSVLSLYTYIVGNCAFAGFAAILVHRHRRDVEAMQLQLQSFKMADAQSYCCTVEHREPDGSEFTCDREVMLRCIQHWFGSIEEFERSVQTKVKDALTQQLGSIGFPYTAIATATLPLLWYQLDFASARFLNHDPRSGLGHLMIGLNATFVICMPSMAVAFLVIHYAPRCSSLLRILLGAVSYGILQLGTQGSLELLSQHWGAAWAEMIWAGLWFIPSLLLWWLAQLHSE